ncbi:putative benzoate 4-monooxygenase cytochrome P450 [Bipolaris maydis]|nr:putative benzoate 4-monooxygenase cytochrome P450 [Bipolaris maydis]
MAFLYSYIRCPFFFGPLSSIPDDWTGQQTRKIHALHLKYGPVVRIGPNEVHFNSLSALRTIYGAGSGFECTEFCRMFGTYGRKNVFTFASREEHAQRKRLAALTPYKVEGIVQAKTKYFLKLVATDDSRRGEHVKLLDDIINHTRHRLSWFAFHLSSFTKWMYTRTGLAESVIRPFLPMAKPATYSGIRAHAPRSMHAYHDAGEILRAEANKSIIRSSKSSTSMDDLDIANGCADHLLAGIETTSDTLMFLTLESIPASECTWAGKLSRKRFAFFAPLPSSEPRLNRAVTVDDGYKIPWFWALSSGARILAIAEMALVPSLYRKCGSRVLPGQENTAPGITCGIEAFADDSFPGMTVGASTKSL